MMDSNFHSEPLRLNDLIDDLVTRHGAWRVLRVLIANLVTRQRRRPISADLTDHLRHDVGLPPSAATPNWRDPIL